MRSKATDASASAKVGDDEQNEKGTTVGSTADRFLLLGDIACKSRRMMVVTRGSGGYGSILNIDVTTLFTSFLCDD